MIVVDTSALVAMLLNEPEAEAFALAIRNSRTAVIAAPTAFEFRLVTVKLLGEAGLERANRLLGELSLTIFAWTAEHVALAEDALLRFGARPARLNFGDCITYAVAKRLGAPLLFKGDDFRHTDIASAL